VSLPKLRIWKGFGKIVIIKCKGAEGSMNDVFSFISQSTSEGKKVALVTVTKIVDGTPATPGQMIAVLPDGSSAGTVGGGVSEHLVKTRAIEAIKNGESVFTLSIDHSEIGMVCGGIMEVFGNVIGNHSGLCIFGGGHIAQSLAEIAALTGFYVTVVEDRPEFETYFNSAKYIVCEPDEYKAIDPAAHADYAVICTRGHSTDDTALRYCLTKNLNYIGMIGSKQKVKTIFSELMKEGIAQEELDKIYAPIGLDIADALPQEIAVAILAEILLLKNNGNLRHMKQIYSLQV
jgi:xanthine dehydrogenase accessory factor